MREEKKEKENKKKWMWYHFLFNLSNGDILKFEEASKLNLIFAFSYLSFKKSNSI